MSSHPTPEAVSDLVEGLLPQERQEAVETHLAGCAECRDLRDALSDVRALLSGLPDAHMPDDVAVRLDRALAEARPASSPGASEGLVAGTKEGAAPPAGPVELAARRRHRRVAAAVGAAAASLVLVMGGMLLVLSGGQPSGDQASSGAALERAAPDAGAAESGQTPARAAKADGFVTASGREYTRRSLASGVASLLHAQPLASARGEAFDGVDDQRLANPSALDSCLSAIAPDGARPLAVDLATYAGEPGAVIALPIRHNSDVVDVWVVTPECTSDRPHVVVRERVPRP
jgi:anti-sigma factor RsiW